MTASFPKTDLGLAKRNVAVLFYLQAVLGAQIPINMILGGLAGVALAGNPAYATLPVSFMVLASMFTAPAASAFMGRYGRRAGFLAGALAGACGGALSTYALFSERFELLLAGTALTGVYNACQAFYRFAAVDTSPQDFRARAISWVLAGGLVNALLGPEIVQLTSDYFSPVPYAGAYASVVVVNILGALGLFWLRIPLPERPAAGGSSGRPLGEILRQPRIVVAVVCAMISYALMTLVMTSTPLAVVGHGFSPDRAADIVRWHVLAMFAPSFVTGSIIDRIGHRKVIAIGLLLLGSCGAIALSGVHIANFYLALIALGIGWNFGFIGSTSLLETAHTAEERAKVQGVNDFLVFGLVASASFGSGAMLSAHGWPAVHLAMIPPLAVAALALGWLGRRERAGVAGKRAKLVS